VGLCVGGDEYDFGFECFGVVIGDVDDDVFGFVEVFYIVYDVDVVVFELCIDVVVLGLSELDYVLVDDGEVGCGYLFGLWWFGEVYVVVGCEEELVYEVCGGDECFVGYVVGEYCGVV